MSLVLMLSLLAAQPAPSGPPQPVVVRPGEAPAGTSPVPISEVAEPLAVAVAGFDADGDGLTTRAEYDAALVRTFAAADRDRDEALGYIEYSGWAQTWLGSQSALPGPFAIDADGNDRLSRAEFLDEFGRQYQRLDRDSDGAISHAELLTVRNPRMAPVRDRSRGPSTFRTRNRRDPR